LSTECASESFANRSIISEDIDKSYGARFLWPTVYIRGGAHMLQVDQAVRQFRNVNRRSLQWRAAVTVNTVFKCSTRPPFTVVIKANNFQKAVHLLDPRETYTLQFLRTTSCPVHHDPPRPWCIHLWPRQHRSSNFGDIVCSDTGKKSSFEHKKVKKGAYSSLWEPVTKLWNVTCHMGSHSIICHPTQVNAPGHAGRYSTYLPRRNGRLSWPWCWRYTSMVYLYPDSHPSS